MKHYEAHTQDIIYYTYFKYFCYIVEKETVLLCQWDCRCSLTRTGKHGPTARRVVQAAVYFKRGPGS